MSAAASTRWPWTGSRHPGIARADARAAGRRARRFRAGAFVQLIEFDTDRITEWDAIVDRWADAIGTQHTVRWSALGTDRDRPGRHVAVVEFSGYAEAMANSGHPATAAFLKELQAICSSEPQFRNLDVRSATTY